METLKIVAFVHSSAKSCQPVSHNYHNSPKSILLPKGLPKPLLSPELFHRPRRLGGRRGERRGERRVGRGVPEGRSGRPLLSRWSRGGRHRVGHGVGKWWPQTGRLLNEWPYDKIMYRFQSSKLTKKGIQNGWAFKISWRKSEQMLEECSCFRPHFLGSQNIKSCS